MLFGRQNEKKWKIENVKRIENTIVPLLLIKSRKWKFWIILYLSSHYHFLLYFLFLI